jgi:hypothetical protein
MLVLLLQASFDWLAGNDTDFGATVEPVHERAAAAGGRFCGWKSAGNALDVAAAESLSSA